MIYSHFSKEVVCLLYCRMEHLASEACQTPGLPSHHSNFSLLHTLDVYESDVILVQEVQCGETEAVNV